MKHQSQSAKRSGFPAGILRDLKNAYRGLDRAVRRQPWLVQGSVNTLPAKSASASVTHTWTRKVRAQTVTVALSKKQAAAFRQAIAANRQIEKALGRLRELSQTALLSGLPGVPKRCSTRSDNEGANTVQNGA